MKRDREEIHYEVRLTGDQISQAKKKRNCSWSASRMIAFKKVSVERAKASLYSGKWVTLST